MLTYWRKHIAQGVLHTWHSHPPSKILRSDHRVRAPTASRFHAARLAARHRTLHGRTQRVTTSAPIPLGRCGAAPSSIEARRANRWDGSQSPGLADGFATKAERANPSSTAAGRLASRPRGPRPQALQALRPHRRLHGLARPAAQVVASACPSHANWLKMPPMWHAANAAATPPTRRAPSRSMASAPLRSWHRQSGRRRPLERRLAARALRDGDGRRGAQRVVIAQAGGGAGHRRGARRAGSRGGDGGAQAAGGVSRAAGAARATRGRLQSGVLGHAGPVCALQ